jgi:hypothetical protein
MTEMEQISDKNVHFARLGRSYIVEPMIVLVHVGRELLGCEMVYIRFPDNNLAAVRGPVVEKHRPVKGLIYLHHGFVRAREFRPVVLEETVLQIQRLQVV